MTPKNDAEMMPKIAPKCCQDDPQNDAEMMLKNYPKMTPKNMPR